MAKFSTTRTQGVIFFLLCDPIVLQITQLLSHKHAPHSHKLLISCIWHNYFLSFFSTVSTSTSPCPVLLNWTFCSFRATVLPNLLRDCERTQLTWMQNLSLALLWVGINRNSSILSRDWTSNFRIAYEFHLHYFLSLPQKCNLLWQQPHCPLTVSTPTIYLTFSLWGERGEAELERTAWEQNKYRLVSRVLTAGTLTTALAWGYLNPVRLSTLCSVWSCMRGKQAGWLDAFMFTASLSDSYPGLSPALGYTFTFPSRATRLHEKLLKV